jgi:hypothetical protein
MATPSNKESVRPTARWSLVRVIRCTRAAKTPLSENTVVKLMKMAAIATTPNSCGEIKRDRIAKTKICRSI